MARHNVAFLVVISLHLAAVSHGFVVSKIGQTKPSFVERNKELFMTVNDHQDESRRALLRDAVIATSLQTLWTAGLAPALAETDMGMDVSSPIAVIGAGGKTGRFVTEILANGKRYVRAITRSGKAIMESPYTTFASGDVTKYESIRDALKGASGAVFAASASGKNKGGDPAHVDYLGLYNTAKACLECNVPKLVVISAGSVTRPDFVGFKATNLFVKYVYGEKIMDYKIAGEAVMRNLYETSGTSCSYCVIRPGGLSDKESEGPKNVHVSQGDVYSSEVTRKDIAQVTVAALLKGKATDNTTVEVNARKGLYKVLSQLDDAPSELIHDGAETYDGLLDNLLTDAEMKKKYPKYMNDFAGDKIEPISKIV